MPSSPHLLLVGGGHASVAVLRQAHRWTRAGVRVTLLSDAPALYYSGMVPEYLGGVYAQPDVTIDLVGWCARHGVAWHEGRAVAVDPAAHTVTTTAGATLSYDLVAFDIGAHNPYGSAIEAITTKPLHRVERLAQWLAQAIRIPGPHHLVVAGGGAAGVEVALNVSARTGGHVHCTVVEPSERLLRTFPPGMGHYAAHLLRRRGADLCLGVSVGARSAGAVTLSDGTARPCDALLWATGSVGQRLFAAAGLPCDDRGFVRVARTLRCPIAPALFAAGDCAAVQGLEHLARVGVHAVRQGPLLAENLDRSLAALRAGRSLDDVSLRPFRPYPVAPLVLSTGTREGLWTAGPLWVRHPLALRLKHVIDLRWMNAYRLPGQPRWSLRQVAHARSAADDRAPQRTTPVSAS